MSINFGSLHFFCSKTIEDSKAAISVGCNSVSSFLNTSSVIINSWLLISQATRPFSWTALCSSMYFSSFNTCIRKQVQVNCVCVCVCVYLHVCVCVCVCVCCHFEKVDNILQTVDSLVFETFKKLGHLLTHLGQISLYTGSFPI